MVGSGKILYCLWGRRRHGRSDREGGISDTTIQIIVIVGVVVLTIVGTIFIFRDGPGVCVNPVCLGPGNPAGANVIFARD